MQRYDPQTGNPDEPAWHITRVEDAFGAGALATSNRVKRIWFHIRGDGETYVEVSLADFLNDNYVNAIEEQVRAHVKALQLTAGSSE